MLVRLGQEVQEVPRGLAPPDPPLADDEIRLEPLDERFTEGFVRLLDDPAVIRTTRVPSSPPEGFAAQWIGFYRAGWEDGSRAGFAMLTPRGEFLGFAAIVDLDLEGREGEIGYVVTPDARGRGVATRGLRLVTGWALDELGLLRVELHIDPENTASIRVAENCGYVREGVHRSVHFKEDKRNDLAIYSLLPGDPR